jgi:hypothetical protein
MPKPAKLLYDPKKSGFFSPAKERSENENALLDRDGFPPCVMKLDEFVSHIRELFDKPDCRIVAFKVRGFFGSSTLTTRRGDMHTIRVTKAQRAAYAAALKEAT